MRTLLITLLVLALAPAAAHAGTYDVRLCGTGFTARNDDPAAFTTTASCPTPGLYAGVRPGGARPATGATAGWTISAPAGTTLRTLLVRRSLAKQHPGYEVAVRTREGTVLDLCPLGCLSTPATVTYTPLATQSVAFTVACTAVCADAPAWLAIHEATATIEDTRPPTVAVEASGWRRTPEVAVTAEDASGIQGEGCDFTRLPPCPVRARRTQTYDLPDGVHSVRATVTDAAGNTTSVPATLRLDRVAPAAPLDLAVDGTTYTWRNPDSTAPIVAAHFSDGTIVRGEGIERAQASSGDLSVWLEDAAGNVDPANAAAPARPRAIGLQPPALVGELRITRTIRSRRTLTLRGVATERVTVTLTRRGVRVRRSVRPRNGRWSVKLRVKRRGTYRLTVRSGGETVRKRVRL